jgi:hypothetical protein
MMSVQQLDGWISCTHAHDWHQLADEVSKYMHLQDG